MITEEDLRASLAERATGAPDNGSRTAQVHRRVLVARRRRLAGASTVLVLAVAAVVAVVPVATRHSGAHQVVPAHVRSPYPAYAQGGEAIAGGLVDSPRTGTLTFKFVPTSYRLFLGLQCVRGYGASVAVSVNGRPTLGGGCAGGAGNPSDAVDSAAEWRDGAHVVLGRPNTVTVTLVTPSPHSRPLAAAQRGQGTVAAAVYQAVPVAAYPLPKAPPTLAPLGVDGPGTTLLDSRHVGANGTFTTEVTVGAHAALTLNSVAPGQLSLTIGGKPFQVDAFWDYGSEFASLDVTPAALRDRGITAADGERVAVTVTASRFAGPYWLVTENQHLS